MLSRERAPSTSASSPVTTSGTIAISYTNGYSIPTTAKQTAWDGKQDAITTTNKLSTDKISGLATVATSGSYNDLSNRPTTLKNPNALNLKVNSETSNFVSYDGSAAKTLTVKPSTTAGAFEINDGTTTKTIQLAGTFTDNNT